MGLWLTALAALWAAWVLVWPWIAWRRWLLALWREPVLRAPVLIIESDDWGPGPGGDALALRELADRLMEYTDRQGGHPVMTLGVVLSMPWREAMVENRFQSYVGLDLGRPEFDGIRQAMEQGRRQRVFALQLHGREHLWPAALSLAAQAGDGEVLDWFAKKGTARCEELPSPLQSRWTDASRLPSLDLSTAEIERAVTDEAGLFRQVFGEPARVAVPPTFVWNETVERAWAASGVRTVITPGRRYAGRGADGAPDRGSAPLRTAQSGAGGVGYLVRDVYFEPALGHRAADGLRGVSSRWRLRRPALLETHRFNFVDDKGADALAELSQLLSLSLAALPGLRFMSSQRLAEILLGHQGDLIESRWWPRLGMWLRRLRSEPPAWRWIRGTGLVVIFLPLLALSDRLLERGMERNGL